MSLIYSFGGSIDDGNGNFVFNTPQNIEAISFLNSLFNDVNNISSIDYLYYTNEDMYNKFNNMIPLAYVSTEYLDTIKNYDTLTYEKLPGEKYYNIIF